MNKIIIITSYIEFSDFLTEADYSDDYVICTDGGYDIAVKHRISPNLLLGDFDSIASNIPSDIEIEKYPPEKDFTDLEITVKKAIELNASNVEILGGIGGRLDHTVANLQILSHYSMFFGSLIMYDGKNKCFIAKNGKNIIPYERDSYLSIFSLSEKCEGITFENVRYPLKNHTLTRSFPLGVSNEFINEKSASLSVKSGTLLTVISGK